MRWVQVSGVVFGEEFGVGEVEVDGVGVVGDLEGAGHGEVEDAVVEIELGCGTTGLFGGVEVDADACEVVEGVDEGAIGEGLIRDAYFSEPPPMKRRRFGSRFLRRGSRKGW